MTEVSPYITYLEGKRLTPETATPQQLSDAKAYEACYNWYISRQKVQPSVAELAAHTFIQKYALHDASGFCMEDNPEAMWIRIADVLAGEEVKTNPNNKDRAYWFNEFASILVDFKYSPQGSGLYSLGNDVVKASASNCFVVPSPSDSLESIFDTAKFMARIYAARGGVGVDISDLRPFGATTNNAAKSSTGAASFMDFYSHVTSTIGQAGRRGALMLSIRVDHPDIFRFIEMKRDLDKQWFFNELSDYGIDINDWKYSAIADRLKSTSHANVSVRLNDKFIKAVENDEQFELYFDFADDKYPRISQFVRARDIWDKLIEGATEAAEPGMLNWDKITSESPADCYAEPTLYTLPDGKQVEYSFRTISTNPCITGDTQVAVADGRGFVSIKELADTGMDVPVYCSDNTGHIKIRTMRNPRITGYNQKILKLILEGGHEIKCTTNHKIMLSDMTYKEAKDIKVGDGLSAFYKKELSIKDVFPNANSNSQDYLYLCSPFYDAKVSDHRAIYEHYNGPIVKGNIIHHKDYNAQNNLINNLVSMSVKTHNILHTQNMIGDKNPVFKIKADPEKSKAWRNNLSKACSGSLNGNAKAISNEDIYHHALALTKTIGRRFSKWDWLDYAKNHDLPVAFTQYRESDLGSLTEVSYKAAKELGFTNIELDPRQQKTIQSLEEQGYNVIVDSNIIKVERFCEHCGTSFIQPFNYREVSFCSLECSSKHHYISSDFVELRNAGINRFHIEKNNKQKYDQAKVASDLRFELKRDPLKKEWEARSKELNVPYRLATKYGYASYSDVIEASKNVNHKVISIEEIGTDTVYNGTVDEFHNFFIGGFEEENTVNGRKKRKFLLINNLQCGELPLSAGDSCCLGTHNLPSFVRNPYTPNAKFDWMEFKRVVFLSTRAQDNIKNIDIDLVPLEINRQSAILGRRIGLGCTGLSDALAMLGLRYDSPKALAMTEKIYSALRDTAYASSIELASEKGAFLAYAPEKEVNNPFLSRLPETLQNKPRRNIALLTNAPNGSMAIIMNNGSSGIEPCFKKEYLRNVKVPGTNDFRQFQVYHQPIADCIAAGGDPSVFVEANDVSGEMRIKLQAAIQKYIDHSISVTTNLPAGTTKERVSELYLQAFKEGCKGFTVYVDGCRTGVLTSIKEPVKIHKTLERPKTTNIDIHKVKYKDKQWAVLVGRADNGPLEVFAGIEEETPLPNKYHRAELTKKSRGHYSLTVFLSEDEDDLIKISNIGARFPSPEGMTLTRFISLSLKHGVPVGDICEQLTKSSNSMFDYPAVLNRVLKNYVSEDEYTKKNGEKTCPDCGSKLTFRKVDGCMVEICGNCSYTNSKCG